MALRIACRTCGTAFLLDDSYAGKKVRCCECRDVIAVPKRVEPEPVPPREPELPLDSEKGAAAFLLADSPSPPKPCVDDLPVLQLAEPPRSAQKRTRPAAKPAKGKLGPVIYVAVLLAGVLFGGLTAYIRLVGVSNPRPVPQVSFGPPVVAKPPLAAIAEPPAVPITPAPLTKETSYKLSEPAATLCVGGGGRYLVLHLPVAGKFAVFDTSAATVVREIPGAGANVRFAAGMDDLLVCESETGIVRRYALATGQVQATGRLILPRGPIKAFCLGHASAGPLLVNVWSKDKVGYECLFFDPKTFEELTLPEASRFTSLSAQYWAGATGHVFCGKEQLLRLVGDQLLVSRHDGVTDVAVPGPDDRHFYSFGRGVLDLESRSVPDTALSRSRFDAGQPGQFCLPAAHGTYYLHARTPIGERSPLADWLPKLFDTASIRLHRLGTAEPLATFSGVPLERFVGGPGAGLAEFGVENSVHWIPAARLLVVVPPSRDELRLYPAPDGTGPAPPRSSVLEFTSPSPPTARRGETFAYTPTVVANRPPVAFRLEGAPTGMTVGEQGTVTFDVPAEHLPAHVAARLIARDATGREVEQALRLDLGEPPSQARDPLISLQLSLRTRLPLRAPTSPVEVRPAALDQPVTLPLPAAAGAACLGGGGRYLALHLPAREEVAVFDVSAAKIVRAVPAKGRDVHVAAGRDELVTYDHATGEARRYRLEDGTPLGPGKLDLADGPVESFCLGHASAGPLLASVRGRRPALYDLATLGRLDLSPRPALTPTPRTNHLPTGRYEAGPNGRLFTCRVRGQVCTVRLYPDHVLVEAQNAPVTYAVPGLDDRVVFLGGRGVATERLFRQEDAPPPAQQESPRALVATAEPYLPAAHGPYYFRVEKTPAGAGRVCWFALGSKEPLDTVEPPGLPAYSPADWTGLPVEQSFHLVPGAKVLVAVAASRRELLLFPADPEGWLAAVAPPGCIFTSPAFAAVRPGTTWTYHATVRGKHGKLAYSLPGGPPGAAIDEAGKVTWDVPDTFHGATVLTLVATDARGKAFRHPIRLEPELGR